MCLTVTSRYHNATDTPHARIAYAPLLVWKALWKPYDRWRGVYQNYEWTFNTLHTAKFVIEQSYNQRETYITEGLHAFRTQKAAEFEVRAYDNHCVFPAIIPAGTALYVGENLDIVSEALIVYETMDALRAARPHFEHTECAPLHFSTPSKHG